MEKAKVILLKFSLLVGLFMFGSQVVTAENVADFTLYSKVYDYGQRVFQVEIDMPYEVLEEDINPGTFNIMTSNSLDGYQIDNGAREIVKTEIVNNNGDGIEQGEKIRLTLDSKLNSPFSSTLFWDEAAFVNRPMKIVYKINQEKPINGKTVKKFNQKGLVNLEADDFEYGESQSGLNYRDFKPKDKGDKHPLIIWLHGAGEGGDNNEAHITANRGATAFVNPKTQKIFGYPYVLAPQSPDFWMPEFQVGNRTLIGKNHTKQVISLIEEYLEQHSDIDKNRVYIGGASMGGYQTWETIFAKPELFAAAFPTCAAYEVPVDNLEKVKNLPIWITHAKSDDTVPFKYSKNAYESLKKIGGIVEFTEYNDVKIGSEPFSPHASWVYVLKNKPQTEEGNHIFEWMASKKNDTSQNALSKNDTSNNKTKKSNSLKLKIIIILVLAMVVFTIVRTRNKQ